MEELTSALNNLTVLLIAIGGSLFTLCLAAGAILYVTAVGEGRAAQLADWRRHPGNVAHRAAGAVLFVI